MLLNCVLEKTLESPLDCEEIKPVHPKGDQSWVFIGRLMLKLKLHTLATWWEELTHLKRPWCWERLRAGEGDDRGLDGGMASLTQWTWVWVGSGSWWWTGRPGMLQLMESQRVGHDWATELNWTEGIMTRNNKVKICNKNISHLALENTVLEFCYQGLFPSSLLKIMVRWYHQIQYNITRQWHTLFS